MQYLKNTSVFGDLSKKQFTMNGEKDDAIVYTKIDVVKANEKRRAKDMYRQMSEAEMEIINFKNKQQFEQERDMKEMMKKDGQELIDDNMISEEYRPLDE